MCVNEIPARILRLDRDRHGVGSHVSDQTDMSGRRVNALIQLLGNPHRGIRGKTEHGTGGLLKRTRDKRRRRIPFARLRLNRRDFPRRSATDSGKYLVGLFPAADLKFSIVDPRKAGRKLAVLPLRKFRKEIPVFFRNERLNLTFPLTDKAQRNRLDASRTHPALDPRPQQRTDHIADDTVQHTARLLGVDQIHIQFSGVLKRLRNGTSGNLMKRNPAETGFFIAVLQDLVQMPCDRLPFAVRVGSKIDLFDCLCGFLEFGKILAARLGLLILRSEIMLDVNAERPFGQIADMTIRSFDNIVLSEDLPYGLCLGGRLHDHKFVRHLRTSPTKIPVFFRIYIYLQCRRFPGMSRAKYDFFRKNTKI